MDTPVIGTNIPSPLQVLLNQSAGVSAPAAVKPIGNISTPASKPAPSNPPALNIITGKTQQPTVNIKDMGNAISNQVSKATSEFKPVSYNDYLKPTNLISTELGNVKAGLDTIAAPFQGVYDEVIAKHFPTIDKYAKMTGMTPHDFIPFMAMMATPTGDEGEAVSMGSKFMNFLVNEALPMSKKMGIATAVIDSPTLKKSASDYIDDIGASMIAGFAMSLGSEYIAKPTIGIIKGIGNQVATVAKDTLSKAQDKSQVLDKLVNWVTAKIATFGNIRGMPELAANQIKNTALEPLIDKVEIAKADKFLSQPDVMEALKEHYQNDPRVLELKEFLSDRNYPENEAYKILAYKDGMFNGTHNLSENFKDQLKDLKIGERAKNAGQQHYGIGVLQRAEKVSTAFEDKLKNIDDKYNGMINTLNKVRFNNPANDNSLKTALSDLGNTIKEGNKEYLYKRSAIENDYKTKLTALNEEAKTVADSTIIKNKLQELNKTYGAALKDLDNAAKAQNKSQFETFFKQARVIAKNERNKDLENYLLKGQQAIDKQIGNILNRKSGVLDRLAQKPITQVYYTYNNPSLTDEAKIEELGNLLHIPTPETHLSYTQNFSPTGIQNEQKTSLVNYLKTYLKNPKASFVDELTKTFNQQRALTSRYQDLELLSNYKIKDLRGGLADLHEFRSKYIPRDEQKRLGNLPVVGTKEDLLTRIKQIYHNDDIAKDTFKDLYSETKKGLDNVYYAKHLKNWFDPEKTDSALNFVDTINQTAKSAALVGSPFHAFTLLKSALYSNTPLSLDDFKMLMGTIMPLYPKSFMEGIDDTNSQLAKRILDIADQKKVNILATPGRSEFSKGTNPLTRELFGEDSPTDISQSIKDGKYGQAVKSIFKSYPSKQERMLWDGLYRRLKLEGMLQELTSNRPVPEIEARLNNLNKFYGGIWQYMYSTSPAAKSFLRFVFLAPDFFTAGLSRFVQAPGDAQLMKYLLIEHTFNFMMNAGGRGLLGQDPQSLKARWDNWLSEVSKFRNPYEFFQYVNGVPTQADTAGYEMEVPRIAEGIARDIYLKNLGHIPQTLLKNWLSKSSMIVNGIATLSNIKSGMTKQSTLIDKILSLNFLTSNLPVDAIGKIPDDQLAPLFMKYLLFNSTGSRMYMLSDKAIKYAAFNLLTQHSYNNSTIDTLNAFMKASKFKNFPLARQELSEQWCLENFGKNYERTYTNAVNKYMQGKESAANLQKSVIAFAKQYQSFYNGLNHTQRDFFLTPVEFANYTLKKAGIAAKKQINTQADMFQQPAPKPVPQQAQSGTQATQQAPQEPPHETWNADKTYDTAYKISKDPQTAAFITAIAQVESTQNPQAVNGTSGATGLMQFMPATAKEYNINPNDPVQSIQGAITYLNKLINKTGSVQQALYYYSGGNPNYPAQVLAYYKQICYQLGIKE